MTTHDNTGGDSRELAQLRLERHHHSDDDLDGVALHRAARHRLSLTTS